MFDIDTSEGLQIEVINIQKAHSDINCMISFVIVDVCHGSFFNINLRMAKML